MKINRFVALLAIAVLIVGVMGVISSRTFAQGGTNPGSSDCGADTEDDDSVEAAESGPDTDDIQDECGNQSGDDTEDVDGTDTEEDADKAGEVDTPPADTAISADQAQAAAEKANPGVKVLGVEYENNGGVGVWEVELENGQDVVVDASSGALLPLEDGD